MQQLPLLTELKEDALGELVSVFPDLAYLLNGILEECVAPDLNRKAGAILWLVGQSPQTDTFGPCISHSEVVSRFGEWFANLRHAPGEVSKAKHTLLAEGYILIAGGADRIQLTDKGKAKLHQMRRTLRDRLADLISVLSASEAVELVGSIGRITSKAAVKRKPPSMASRPPTRATSPRGVDVKAKEA
jgi:hypothetical protein